MKNIIFVLLILSGLVTQAADKNIEVLLGLRTGGGWVTQNGSYNSSEKLSSTYTKYQGTGYTIPIGIELLFDIRNFRAGYSFCYKTVVRTKSTEQYVRNDFFTHTVSEGTRLRTDEINSHFLINSIFIEYAFRIKPKFAIAPVASVGLLISNAIVIHSTASLNFEIMDKKATTFVISPTYAYYTGKKRIVSGHTVSLEVAFRFRLNKKKENMASTKPEPLE